MLSKAEFLEGLDEMEIALEMIRSGIQKKMEIEMEKLSVQQWYLYTKVKMKLDNLEKREEEFRKIALAQSYRIDEKKKTS
ncbi:hypothetical protein BpJC7_20490 [Weizmannia acidilactici]|uniref:Uncharacterized protein n=1 Tax=Weizmannia acidilactici TaxID=2607726 RepID=A0A5J4J745_9BACI|nr:hypothetical protein [Weizmannia acidilactici]GER67888.1 hypothetical protein BpJC4_23590 [Weizmannia acidilactici]GER70746.1 hypothetical protein BpJC7_20490 [Weizmannia acidilactici]GER73731.1 hypothetical protein BpPP18_17980 [Weizmannia acidilactici]